MFRVGSVPSRECSESRAFRVESVPSRECSESRVVNDEEEEREKRTRLDPGRRGPFIRPGENTTFHFER